MVRVEQAEFRFESLLEQIATLQGGHASVKGPERVFDIAPDIPARLIGDPLRLGQVLLNYVGNAIKFTEAGEVLVSARLQERGESHAIPRFTVRDTGIGMSEEQLARGWASRRIRPWCTARRHRWQAAGFWWPTTTPTSGRCCARCWPAWDSTRTP